MALPLVSIDIVAFKISIEIFQDFVAVMLKCQTITLGSFTSILVWTSSIAKRHKLTLGTFWIVFFYVISHPTKINIWIRYSVIYRANFRILSTYFIPTFVEFSVR